MTTDWVPESRDVPEELDDDYQHETFPPAPVRFASWTEQLEAAKFATLKEWAAGGTGEVNYRHTEIGTE